MTQIADQKLKRIITIMTIATASIIDPLIELAFPVFTVPEGKLATVIVPLRERLETGARNVVAEVIVEMSDAVC